MEIDQDDAYAAPWPHCDSHVLHAPDVCKYCDMYPDLQQARTDEGINFTGEGNPKKLPCPAERERSFETINRWVGNAPLNPYQERMDFLADNEKDL